MKNHFFIFLVLSFSILSCGTDENKDAQNYERVNYEEGGVCEEGVCDGGACDSGEEYVREEVPHEPDPKDFHGFIGNSAVTAVLDFDYGNSKVYGHYSYDSYKKKIILSGNVTDWYGGEIYTIQEEDENGNPTGSWNWFSQRNSGTWEGSFQKDEESDALDIVLLADESDYYLHPEAKMVFESKSAADKFFDYHHFLNDEIDRKQGIIVYNEEEKRYNKPILPPGITLYEHDGGDGFGVEPFAIINDNGEIEFEDGKTETLAEYGINDFVEIDYELSVLRFENIPSSGYITIDAGENYSVYIAIDELEKNYYHLQGDGYWIKNKSGNVLGFFPAYCINSNGDDYHPIINIYTKKDETSKRLLKVQNDDDGYFSLKDVVKYKGEYWADVTFNYHTQVPCSDEIRPEKAPVSGWIRLYDSSYQLVLGYYSRGC